MALIKSATSQRESRDAIVLNLGDLRRDAERMRDAALAERDRIIQQAEAERDRVMAGASETGYDAGYLEGLAQGRAKGEQEGAERAFAESSDRVREVEASLGNLLDEIERERERVFREAKSDLLLFACAFAERVTKKIVELDGSVVDEQLDAALKLVLGSNRLCIVVHPDDRGVCERVAPSFTRRRLSESPVRFEEDASIGRGSVVVRTDKGLIDATVSTQIERIVCSLLGSERLSDRMGDDAASQDAEQS